MLPERHVMGVFGDEDQAVEAVRAIRTTPFRLLRVNSPIPSARLADALGVKPSRVGWFTLAGGIIGFFTGFALAIFTATRWSLVVSGKPIVALIPFVIVGFEFTVLFAVFGNVVGLLSQMRLPGFKGLERYDPRCSGEHYAVLAACEAGRQGELEAFFQTLGGESRLFES